jgi:hypothetical protein
LPKGRGQQALGRVRPHPGAPALVVGPPLPGLLAAGSNGHPKRLSGYDQTWFEILLQILIFHIFIQNIFGFQKLYKNKIWKWENLYYQKIIFIRFSEKLYF